MMRFSNEELLCFHSITEGSPPFGIVIRPFREEELDEVVAKTRHLLEEKKILTREGAFTPEGGAMIRSYELYRNSKTHLILNDIKAALLPGGEWMLIRQDKKGVEMMVTDGGTLLMILLKDAPFLRQESVHEPMFKWAGVDYDDFARDVKLRARGSLMVGEYEDLLPVKERLFYWTEDEGYVYNLNRERHKQLTPRQMRVELLKVFRLPASTEELEQQKKCSVEKGMEQS